MNGSLLGLHQSNCLVESLKCYLQEETFLRPVSNLLNYAFFRFKSLTQTYV